MAGDTELSALQLAQRLGGSGDKFEDFLVLEERMRDGDHTRRIRKSQFAFAMAVLSAVTGALALVVGLDVWSIYWPLPGSHCEPRACVGALHHGGYIVDWAKALINTLFGAALALALGSVYSPPERRV